MPLLLDLFCGAGGAGKGYSDAGFEVVGVDSEPQPDYPFEFHQADALTFPLDGFDVFHGSPPCHAFTRLRFRTGKEYADLVDATRQRLIATGRPYVIENVPGAPLLNPIMLCGSSFGLGANGRQLRRHRLFESNVPLMSMPCQHRGEAVGVYGTGGGGKMTRGYKGTQEEYVEAMEMPWASRAGIAQAIPPAYTRFIGEQIIRGL